jgi:arylsulfatase A-like enzyme
MFASSRARLRRSLMVEYWAENAMPWLVGMSYKAVRTERYKYIHWVNRGRDGELDELYDLETDPWELKNLNRSRAHAATRERLRRDLGTLVKQSVGL